MSALPLPVAEPQPSAVPRSPATDLAGAMRARRLPPAWSLTAIAGALYVILGPSSPDLAAASYRSYLFAHFGVLLWDNSWYGGHHLLAYSLLAPPLGALIGPRAVVAISMALATALFGKLTEPYFPARARVIAGYLFALGAAVALLSGRVPFDLGLAVGLAAALLARRAAAVSDHAKPPPGVRRGALAGALALALLCSLASPVAGAFLALAFIACALTLRPRARWLALVAATLLPIALLEVAFPEGGQQPFVASAFYPALLGVIVLALLTPARQRTLRLGIVLYGLALTGSYVIPTAMGGNADRLGSLVGAPLAACLLGGGRLRGRPPGVWGMRLLLVLAPAFVYWQVNAPLADFASALGNPSVNASYYAPLVSELGSLGVGYGARPARIEVVPTAVHWEARWLAPHVMIARGWERQLDVDRNDIFYSAARLDAARYRGWLEQQAISYVALPDASLDYSGREEARLVRSAPGYLREVWRSPHWRLFAVLDPAPLAEAPARLTAAAVDSLTVAAPRAGSYTIRVHFTPYWALARGHGCVERAGGEWTRLDASSAGTFELVIRFAPDRILDHGRRCT